MATRWTSCTLDNYNNDIARLTEIKRTLPKVRRALANVPTYMIFDDHEISDDWFLNPTWRDRCSVSPRHSQWHARLASSRGGATIP